MLSRKLILLAILIISTSILAIPKNAEARSGCCSWHGGVCGCRCCDGTPLSATCSPYYPSCGYAPSHETKTCTPAFIDDTYCKYESYVYQKYRSSTCLEFEYLKEVCPPNSVCEDGKCEERCTPEFISPVYCKGKALYREYRHKDCSIDELLVKTCFNGTCENGECKNVEYCGGSLCQGKETCTTCPKDCECKEAINEENTPITSMITNITNIEKRGEKPKRYTFYDILVEFLSMWRF